MTEQALDVDPGSTLLFSESVTEGHPDKVADFISDSVLDACLDEDPGSRVGVRQS